jgi:signal transduction histidine kinase
MVPSIEPGDRFVPSPWKGVRELYGLVILFCALAAAIVSLASPSLAGFLRWLFITESIGVTAVTIGALLSRLPRLRTLPPHKAHAVIGGVAIPAGYFLGSSFAYAVLGEPWPMLNPGPRRVIALLATALAAIFLVYLDAMRQRMANEAAARIEAQRLAGESRLRLLRAQLEPHMLFNTLANLRSLIDVDAKRAQVMIDHLILYLRSTLVASRQETVALGQEFAQLRAYLEIMAARMGPRLSFEFELPPSLEALPVPPMLLQPLVENAIKHGIEPKIGPSSIRIEARAAAGGAEIVVADTGLGLRENAADTGYGLVHVRERLRAAYGDRATLSIEASPGGGARAAVRLPA